LFCLYVILIEDDHNSSTPLKSGIRIYRRLDPGSHGSSPVISKRSARDKRTSRRSNYGRDECAGGLKTVSDDMGSENDGGASLAADDDKHVVSVEMS